MGKVGAGVAVAVGGVVRVGGGTAVAAGVTVGIMVGEAILLTSVGAGGIVAVGVGGLADSMGRHAVNHRLPKSRHNVTIISFVSMPPIIREPRP
jgi:hypothetical protein